MKKILLSVSFVTLGFITHAQVDGIRTGRGYEFTFDGTDESPSFVTKSYTEGCTRGTETPQDKRNEVFVVDGSTSGQIELSVNGEQASWEHFELTFPNTDVLANSIDLSDEAHQLIEITFSSDVSGQLLITFADATTVDNNGWQVHADNTPAIMYDYLASNGEVTITNNSDTYDGNDTINGGGGFGWKDYSTGLYIDSTAITEIWINFRRGSGIEPNCEYSNEPDSMNVAGTLTITSIRIGEVTAWPLGINNKAQEATFQAYPNPSKGMINFSKELDHVEVYNLQGIRVEQFDAVSAINTSGFEPGLYVIQTTEGFKRITVE